MEQETLKISQQDLSTRERYIANLLKRITELEQQFRDAKKGGMSDKELVQILVKECECRAAANTGEERRFFQALVTVLKGGVR